MPTHEHTLNVALTLSLVAVLSLAVGAAVITADEDTEHPETVTTTLHPGDNFIGWVAESLPLDELLVQVPGVVRVSGWDAVDQREVSATVDANRRWSGPLQALEPGAAYVIRLGGDSSVEWSRPIVPAAGLVELRTGINWAAWLGPDDWSITDVAKGIGKFLTEIRLGDYLYSPASPETADDWPTVSRGDALVVAVSRGVNWLQPTYVMPKLVLAGSNAQGARRAAERDLTDMAAYNAEEFGVQADPFSLVVIVAGDVRSLFNELERQGRPREWENLRNWWTTGSRGYHSRGNPAVAVIKAQAWDHSQGRYSAARYVLMEEYFHAIQYQLAGAAADWPPTWMVEGSINWIRGDLATRERTGYPLSRRLIDARNQASKGPPLEEIESGNATWQYSFGLIAADLLIERAGPPALLDFFRAFAPGRTGSSGQWESQLTWQGAFAATYEISIDEFYEEFETVMAKLRGSARRRPASNQVSLSGTVVDRDGSPQSGVRLTSYEIKNGAYATFGSAQSKSDQDGEFTLLVRKRADHRIWIRLADRDGCRHWWTSEGDNEAQSAEDAELIEVGANDPPPLTITVDGDKCRWRISGTLAGPEGEPLAGIEVSALGSGDSITARTEIDGSFDLVTTSPGSHQLYADLDGCRLYWHEESPSEDQDQVGEIEVVDQDVTDLQFTVPAGSCDRVTISGRLLDSTGRGIVGVRVYAQADGDRVHARTDGSGRFHIKLSEPGDYRLYAFVDGCLIYYRQGSATGDSAERSLITLSELDVYDLVFQLQDDMCTLRVSGTLSNAEGSPKSGVYVLAQDGPLQGGDWPSEDGAFSFTVPAAGSYKLNVTIDGCRIFFSGDGVSGPEDSARPIRLYDSNIADIRFVLPETPCLAIEGHLFDSNGNAMEGQSISASSDDSQAHDQDATDANGRFRLTLSEPGDYRLSAWINGCQVFYRQGGISAQKQESALISLTVDDVTGVRLQLQPDMCTLRVSGVLLNADGSPKSRSWVSASGEPGAAGAWTSAGGAFSFAVPSPGSYRLSVWIDGCTVILARDGTTVGWSRSEVHSLTDSDITGIEFRLPEDPASFCN